jgi:hypothetical protein
LFDGENISFDASLVIYSVIQKGGLKFVRVYLMNNWSSRLAHSCIAASVEGKMATMQHKIFCVREFIKTESATAVQRAFRLRFNIQRWYLKI